MDWMFGTGNGGRMGDERFLPILFFLFIDVSDIFCGLAF